MLEQEEQEVSSALVLGSMSCVERHATCRGGLADSRGALAAWQSSRKQHASVYNTCRSSRPRSLLLHGTCAHVQCIELPLDTCMRTWQQQQQPHRACPLLPPCRWQAAINSGGKYLYLGSYVAEDDAAKAFDRAAIKLRNKKAKLNFTYEDYVDKGEG